METKNALTVNEAERLVPYILQPKQVHQMLFDMVSNNSITDHRSPALEGLMEAFRTMHSESDSSASFSLPDLNVDLSVGLSASDLQSGAADSDSGSDDGESGSNDDDSVSNDDDSDFGDEGDDGGNSDASENEPILPCKLKQIAIRKKKWLKYSRKVRAIAGDEAILVNLKNIALGYYDFWASSR